MTFLLWYLTDDKHIDVLLFLPTVRLLILLILTKDYILLWGSGQPYREFLHVDDLANAAIFLMNKYNHQDFVDTSFLSFHKLQTQYHGSLVNHQSQASMTE